MNEELFNEASKSNILSKQLVDQLQESMTYSSISLSIGPSKSSSS